jgi:hypothetical protein
MWRIWKCRRANRTHRATRKADKQNDNSSCFFTNHDCMTDSANKILQLDSEYLLWIKRAKRGSVNSAALS